MLGVVVNEAAMIPVLQILSRGVYPGGGGEVEFSCPVVRRMKPVQMMDSGKVRRVRGIAYPYNRYNTTIVKVVIFIYMHRLCKVCRVRGIVYVSLLRYILSIIMYIGCMLLAAMDCTKLSYQANHYHLGFPLYNMYIGMNQVAFL